MTEAVTVGFSPAETLHAVTARRRRWTGFAAGALGVIWSAASPALAFHDSQEAHRAGGGVPLDAFLPIAFAAIVAVIVLSYWGRKKRKSKGKKRTGLARFRDKKQK